MATAPGKAEIIQWYGNGGYNQYFSASPAS